MKQSVSGVKKNIKQNNKKSKIMLGIFISIIVLILLLGYLVFFKSNSNNSRGCSTTNYELSEKSTSKVENKIKEIEQVDSVDIYLNVCIVKIIVNLKEDVDIKIIKEKMTDSLKEFDEKVLENYDLELFITSNNEKSDRYPVVVSKHKSQKDFYWE